MKQLVKPMGRGYQTNCYILTKNNKSLIIDAGIDATNWVIANAVNPIAILNTHGHFDHVWSNSELQAKLKIPVYIHKLDEPMLRTDPYGLGTPPSKADFLVDNENWIELGGFKFRYIHMPGHTPGCSMIEFEDRIFSGDFLFDGTIGRYDFPNSDAQLMKSSLQRFMGIYIDDKPIYSGHGASTSVHRVRQFIPRFIEAI